MNPAAHAQNIEALCKEKQTPNGVDSVRLIKEVKDRIWSWIGGFLISLMSVLAVPLYLVLSSARKDIIWDEFFCRAEITFIGVSLMVTIIHDYITNMKSKFPWVNMLILIFGCFIYILIAISCETSQNFNINIAIWFNCIFLSIVLMSGVVEYSKEYKEAKKCKL